MSGQVKLRYVGPHDEVEVAAHDGSIHIVRKGDPAKEFPAAVAKSLLDQPDNWQPEKAPIQTSKKEKE